MAGERIIVVDDDEHIRDLIASYLQRDGYRVEQAQNGILALSAFEREPADLVLLDVMMPELGGFDTCKKLRALEHGEHVAVVFLTAHPDADAQASAIQSGGDDFLAKPVRRVELRMRVRSLLRMKAAEEQRRALVAMIVHDLKSPLAAALAGIDVLRDLARERNDPELADVLPEIHLAATRMHRMVLDILDVDATGGSGLRLRFEPVSAHVMLNEAANCVQRLAQLRKQTIAVRAPEGIRLDADRSILRRIVDNLLDNALKYAPTKSMIEVEAEEDGAHVIIKIADNGPTIPVEMREHIFKPFARRPGDDPRTGHGLGLTFCRRAAEAHGGAIGVEDRQGGGNVFWVKLPRTP